MTTTRRTVALCGAGMISSAHAYAARSLGMPVVAVASRSTERATAKAAELGTNAVSYDRLPAGADIVVVATPPAQHFEHTVHALERGSAVILEKPLVRTLNEADRLLEIAHRHGQRVLYAENLAYAPITRAFIRQVSGIGRIDHLEVRTIQSLPTWGGFTTVEWGGGSLFDLGVHPLALAVLAARAAGAGEVVRVSCRLEGDVTDEHAEVTLGFESGLVGRVVSSWRGGETPVWDIQASSATGVVRAEIMPNLTLERNGEPVPLPASTSQIPFIEQFGYLDQIRSFSADIESRTSPFMDVEFGRWILEIVCASYVSAARDGESTAVPSGCDRFSTPLELWKIRT